MHDYILSTRVPSGVITDVLVERKTNLRHRFFPSDTVFYVFSLPETHTPMTCPKCNGTHEMTVITEAGNNRIRITCPYCNGKDIRHERFYVCEARVYEVSISTNNEPATYSINTKRGDELVGVKEDDLTTSLAEATQIAAERTAMAIREAHQKFIEHARKIESMG